MSLSVRTTDYDPKRRIRAHPVNMRNANDFKLDLNRPYLIKGLMYPRQISFWYGPSTCGKTFFMQYLAWNALCLGQPIFGRRTRPTNVIYLSMEPGALDNRLIAARRVYGETESFYVCDTPMNLFAESACHHQIHAMAEDYRAKLVVIDPLSVAMPGANENDYADVSVVVERLRGIANASGAHVACIAHTGKDEDRGQRGSSHFFASADLVVALSKDGEERTIKIEKARDAPMGGKFRFRLNPVVLGIDADGDEESTLTVEMVEAEKKAVKPKLTDIQRARFEFIRDLFLDVSLTHVGVRPHPDMSPQTCVRRSDVMAAMEAKGWIERIQGQPLKDKERQKFREILTTLEAKRRICANEKWVWLI